MPKVFIPETNFEEMDVFTQKYNVRYRIISDNQNNISAWSPIFEVDPQFIFQGGTIDFPGIISLNKIGSTQVSSVWDSVSIYKEVDGQLQEVHQLESYDVWIKWAGNSGVNPSDWIHRERISSTSVNINIPASYLDSAGVTRSSVKNLYIEIYRPGRPITRYERVHAFLQNATTVNIANDRINFEEGHGSNTGSELLYLSATPIGGLTNNTVYYTRTISYAAISLYPTRNDSLANTNKINLTSTGSGTGSFTGYPFRIYESLITTL